MTTTAQNDIRVEALETDLRRAERLIRILAWSQVVITVALTVAITCLALFITGYLPR